jgi:hypothetical protein
MTNVSIKQSAASNDLTIDITLGGVTRQLVHGVGVVFSVDDGLRFLYIEAVSSETGSTSFELALTNAQRPNGKSVISATGFDGYRKRLGIYVPSVSS